MIGKGGERDNETQSIDPCGIRPYISDASTRFVGGATGQETKACGDEKAPRDFEPAAIVIPPDPSVECDTNFTGADEALFSEGAEERDPSANEALFGRFCGEVFVPEYCFPDFEE